MKTFIFLILILLMSPAIKGKSFHASQLLEQYNNVFVADVTGIHLEVYEGALRSSLEEDLRDETFDTQSLNLYVNYQLKGSVNRTLLKLTPLNAKKFQLKDKVLVFHNDNHSSTFHYSKERVELIKKLISKKNED